MQGFTPLVSDILCTPEGLAWTVGPFLFTFEMYGGLKVMLEDDHLPQAESPECQLAEYLVQVVKATDVARRAGKEHSVLRGAILEAQRIAAVSGINWEGDDDALDKFVQLAHYDKLARTVIGTIS